MGDVEELLREQAGRGVSFLGTRVRIEVFPCGIPLCAYTPIAVHARARARRSSLRAVRRCATRDGTRNVAGQELLRPLVLITRSHSSRVAIGCQGHDSAVMMRMIALQRIVASW